MNGRFFSGAGCVALVVLSTLTGCKKAEEPFEIMRSPEPKTSLARLWQLPDFSLTERDGRKITLADLRGKVWIADFFYTTCPGPCPMLSSRLSSLHRETSSLEDVALVSISTDPAKDTPDVLQQYAAKFGADQKWLFLTGDKAVIFDLANKGFKLNLTEEGGTPREPVTHSTKLVLVDQSGTVRGFYDGLKAEETETILRDVRALLNEPK
jgi:protein SCO1